MSLIASWSFYHKVVNELSSNQEIKMPATKRLKSYDATEDEEFEGFASDDCRDPLK